mmetsp:Transcript_23334/g.78436  ORF Transcript_23334/g.78436 Transcript_23334/m.78436 type:complete len:283 (-) Transcript_23334:252-1100(-)
MPRARRFEGASARSPSGPSPAPRLAPATAGRQPRWPQRRHAAGPVPAQLLGPPVSVSARPGQGGTVCIRSPGAQRCTDADSTPCSSARHRCSVVCDLGSGERAPRPSSEPAVPGPITATPARLRTNRWGRQSPTVQILCNASAARQRQAQGRVALWRRWQLPVQGPGARRAHSHGDPAAEAATRALAPPRQCARSRPHAYAPEAPSAMARVAEGRGSGLPLGLPPRARVRAIRRSRGRRPLRAMARPSAPLHGVPPGRGAHPGRSPSPELAPDVEQDDKRNE